MSLGIQRAFCHEVRYLAEAVKEQQAIIKQLTSGPGEFTYIHPFDLAVLLNGLKPEEIVLNSEESPNEWVVVRQVKYKPSVYIPAKTKGNSLKVLSCSSTVEQQSYKL